MRPESKYFGSLDSFPSTENRSVHLAIGMFDGVHRGHRLVIESAIRAAAESGGASGVLTFWPHPSRLFHPESPVPMILNSEVKRTELMKLRIDFVIEEPFTEAFAATDSSQFVKILKAHIPNLASIHTGENWRFGKGRLGDVGSLKKLGEKEGVSVFSLDCLYVDGERVSSTRIRHALLEGRVEEANRLLGYTYESIGTVTEGKRMGRTIGVPTLNLPFEGELRPKFGVYPVRVSQFGNEESLPGIANFGVRPTVNSLDKPVLEAHLLGECPFTYGDRLRVEWESFLRPEMKFENVDALKNRIRLDIAEAQAYFRQKSDA